MIGEAETAFVVPGAGVRHLRVWDVCGGEDDVHVEW